MCVCVCVCVSHAGRVRGGRGLVYLRGGGTGFLHWQGSPLWQHAGGEHTTQTKPNIHLSHTVTITLHSAVHKSSTENSPSNHTLSHTHTHKYSSLKDMVLHCKHTHLLQHNETQCHTHLVCPVVHTHTHTGSEFCRWLL